MVVLDMNIFFHFDECLKKNWNLSYNKSVTHKFWWILPKKDPVEIDIFVFVIAEVGTLYIQE